MDTKLKNRHKLVVVVLIVLITCLAAISVTEQYSNWYYSSDEQRELEYKDIVTTPEFLEKFVEMTYVLYNHQGKGILTEYAMIEQMEDVKLSYDEFYPYVDYATFDKSGETIETMSSGSIYSTNIADLKTYQTAVIIRYYESVVPHVQLAKGEYPDEQEAVLRDIANIRRDLQCDYDVNVYNKNDDMQTVNLRVPENCTFVIAMSERNQNIFLDEVWGANEGYVPDSLVQWVAVVSLVVAAFAWILPRFSFLQTGNEKIFKVHLEIACIVLLSTMGIVVPYTWGRIIRNYGAWWWYDLFVWMMTFAVVYWASACLRSVCDLGVKRYFRERTLTGIYGRKFWGVLKRGWTGLKKWSKDVYHSFQEIDFTQKNDKTILKLVLINLLILSLICMMWVFGIVALVIYSVILFFGLRGGYNSIQEKYAVLLFATNEIAEGNLEREITEDLGIFNPFKKEITKIQEGFKGAVEKEIKSQRMKTELITNVSHDLKTPLTAIIAYVNLLKDEKDEDKRKEYIEVLDKKSHRLKVLIEDLFEISKASSKNVTLHIMDVDVVSLFKQVKLELEEKFEGTGLDFRFNYPDAPVIMPLDSQKTYRIFENLLVNVAKYAMPNTRVYVDIFWKEEHAVVRIKNISEAELKCDVSEITERFVRGDESRNTEGAGLGLAIVKSFVELQKGELEIETDGDLFKVEVRF